MSSKIGLSFSQAIFLVVATAGAIFGLLGPLTDFQISASTVSNIVRRRVVSALASLPTHSSNDDQPYRIQIFSRDPLVIFVESFLSREEVSHLLHLSEGRYQTSKVYGGYDESRVDPDMRISETAQIDNSDEVVRRIRNRATNFQGWRGNHTHVEDLAVQRYYTNGFYNYHYDWDPSLTEGNRITTFMVYLVGNCMGGGTNFPFLQKPNDTQWCNVIECEEGEDAYRGVTFKPIAGSAVFWENFHPNGSGHHGVYHAGLPVKSGVKVGLNIWSWDRSWRRPEIDEQDDA
ncbi:putative prolyl 4-hydroxylase alpha subunit [Xylariaceae sp. AK1471]|nr:putative prolyl 4-hydroxylase alpha subunit [Xylariaceae sp. AK1471]